MEGRESSTYNQRQVDKGMPVSGCASPQGTTQTLQFGRPHRGRERLLQGQTDGNGTDTPSGEGLLHPISQWDLPLLSFIGGPMTYLPE